MAHRDTLLNPVLIVEVLSESESYDRGKKFAHYRTVASLREYVLVSQVEYRIERFTRTEDNDWIYTDVTGIEASVDLSSIGCRLSMSGAYEKVDFEAARRRASAR